MRAQRAKRNNAGAAGKSAAAFPTFWNIGSETCCTKVRGFELTVTATAVFFYGERRQIQQMSCNNPLRLKSHTTSWLLFFSWRTSLLQNRRLFTSNCIQAVRVASRYSYGLARLRRKYAFNYLLDISLTGFYWSRSRNSASTEPSTDSEQLSFLELERELHFLSLVMSGVLSIALLLCNRVLDITVSHPLPSAGRCACKYYTLLVRIVCSFV